MRDIKFRAWDGDKMICPDYIDRQGRAFWSENSIVERSSIIMQYTGLKDKNGVDIYEGDILRWNNDDGVYFEVFYHDEEARFKCNRTHWQGNRCGGYVPKITADGLEVIGNIHKKRSK